MGVMPCRAIASRSSGRWRRARMPPCTAGCSVLTRPSIISGKLVTSEMPVTVRPASARALAVPPVETSCQPRRVSSVANGIRPVLSETEISARIEQTLYLTGSDRLASMAPALVTLCRVQGRTRGLFCARSHPIEGGLGDLAPATAPARQRQVHAYYWQGQVVQQRQGLRFHRARRRQ